jgi:nucleoid DNA-binding protein
MKNIQNHIKFLLYRNDCIIVEGFGAFVCQKQSAKIQDGFIFPPRKVLSFNSSLKTDDGILAHHIARQEKVSYQIAKQHIKSFSKKLHSTLQEDRKISLTGLGVFTLSRDQNILFQPDKSQAWLLESYGLPNIKPQSLNALNNDDKVISFEKPVAVKSSRSNYWRYAAIGIIAIGISGLVGSNMYKSKVKEHNFVEQVKAKEIVNQKIQESSFVISEPLTPLAVDVKIPRQEPKGKYHIIAGAFRIKENADKKITQLQKQGFEATYLGENAYGLHQIAYESHSDRLEALAALRKIKKQNNSSAWLFVKEL